MVKGQRKRKSTYFREGNVAKPDPQTFSIEPKARAVVRLNCMDYHNVVDSTSEGEIVTRDCFGQPVPCMMLRPREDSESYYSSYNRDASIPQGDDNTYILVHKGKVLESFNQAFKAHKKRNNACEGDLVWNQEGSQQWGMCWSVSLKCSMCDFSSVPYKLYEEVPKEGVGRKAATPNVGLQIGLARQGVSSTGFTDILHATNTSAPSICGMQKAANKITPIIEKVNRRDMADRITSLQSLNARRGLPVGAGISLEADATYNNRLASGVGKTPFQPATRAIFVAAEGVTKEKQIISTKVYTKQCTCTKEGHQEGCTANIAKGAPIGDEGKYLKDTLNEISSNGGPTVDIITLDGDSNSNFTARESGLAVQTCTKHLTRRSIKKVKQTSFSQSMFPGRLKADKEGSKNRFAVDLAQRCQAELQAASQIFPGDVVAVHRRLQFVPDAIMGCYKGDHRLCQDYSLVCTKGKQWQRPFVISSDGHRDPAVTVITPTESDTKKLRECIAMRFSAEAIQKTYLNRTQNKCEASNRGLCKSLPKHMEFRRNASGRAHAAVHSMNNLPGKSLLKLCSAVGSPVARRSKVMHQLEKRDKIVKSDKKRQATPKYKTDRAKRRTATFSLYDAQRSDACYKTGGVVAPVRRAEYNTRMASRSKSNFTTNIEHSYAKNETLENLGKRQAVRAEHSY